MTPAQKLAAKKPRFRSPPHKKPVRHAVWRCHLRRAREDAGLSLDDVATAVGLSKTGYWQVEQGRDPMLTTARKLATFFGATVEAMWPKQVPRTRESK